MTRSKTIRLLMATACAAVFALGATSAGAAEKAVVIPPPLSDASNKARPETETAVFAGGCFWGVQGVFQHVKGVSNAVSGYVGGTAKNANYEAVGTGTTGHAEAVEVTFDPKVISYGKLMQIFFSVAHNPTQLDYQGPDHGPQYRSEIFARSEEQKQLATTYVTQLDKEKLFDGPIVTKISLGADFYPAEVYHQDFLTLNPTYPYIVYNDLPKIDNLKALFPAEFRSEPVLVFKAKG